MLDKEFSFYIKNQINLVKDYEGRYIVLHGEKVTGDYDTELEAYFDALEKFDLGTFLIQHVMPGEASYTIKFHSRVA